MNPLSVGNGRPTLMMADQESEVKEMNQTEIIRLYLDEIAVTAKTISKIICDSDKADSIFALTVFLLDSQKKAEDDMLNFEMDFTEPELVKACRKSLMESNQAVVVHLEKFQSQGYHFESLIHTLKLEAQTLAEEIKFI